MIDRSEELVTVFGGGGFIGRYVCEYLFRSGVRVRVAQRDPRRAYAIQPLGPVGQFGFAKADITDANSVRRALDGASAAMNLVGVFGAGCKPSMSMAPGTLPRQPKAPESKRSSMSRRSART